MTAVKGSHYLTNSAFGAISLLPPKSPFPSMHSAYGGYVPSSFIPAKGIARPRDGHGHHQRTSSETNLIEENPSWLDDLLNESETPIKRGAHRRSSSDSFAYLDMPNTAFNSNDPVLQEYTNRNLASNSSWRDDELNRKNVCYTSHSMDAYNFTRLPGRRQGTPLNTGIPPSPGDLSERREIYQIKESQPEEDQKRAKQQFAQRSRVRKLQYIAELEINVQALQAEGSEVSAELQFLDQQNLILSLENKALKQRLDSLAQEQLLKRFQQDTLEREIARLRAACQQQQQPKPTHNRSSSRDLDSRSAHLSLNHNQAGAARDAIVGPLRI